MSWLHALAVRIGTWARELDRVVAAAQDGVISVHELVTLGLNESTVYRRCRAPGPWQLLAPAIVALHNGEPTVHQREIAALLHGGDGAMLTGISAARHHRLRRGRDPEQVHILVEHGRQVRGTPKILVERTRRLPQAVERDGLAVAPLVRAVCDAARRLRDESEIAAILAEPVQLRRTLPQRLLAELDAGDRRWSSTPRRVLRHVIGGARSAAEFEAKAWWEAQPELPPARWNVRILDSHGQLVTIADAVVEEVGLVWEIDSVEEHFSTPEQVAETARRRRRTATVGLHTVNTRPSQRRDDPEGALHDLLVGLEVARALPPARVAYVDDLPRAA